MAKGNLFLGFGRGKVGDAVFYRTDGEQVTRSRNAHPANPKSYKQCIQRAIAASVQRLYSVGRELFDHSFEGLKVGKANQQRFAKLNMAALRQLVITDLNDGNVDADCRGRVGFPGIRAAVPFVGAVVSEGSLVQNAFQYDNTDEYYLPAHTQGETVAEYAARIGLVPGDIYTFVYIGGDPVLGQQLATVDATSYYASVYSCQMFYGQLRVKDVSEVDDDMTANTLMNVFFEPTDVGVDLLHSTSGSAMKYNDFITCARVSYGMVVEGCRACIRSREDGELRSTERLSIIKQGTYGEFGLTSNHLYDAWNGSVNIDAAELILDGENF